MKKAILISIQPKYVRKILLGEKTLEIRKTKPKEFGKLFFNDSDEPIDVYIYCTKNKGKKNYLSKVMTDLSNNELVDEIKLNGRVVAKFALNKVEKICPRDYISLSGHRTETLSHNDLLQKSCLTSEELGKYLKGNGYAWHIDNLEIFGKPKELREFNSTKGFTTCEHCLFDIKTCNCEHCNSLTRAPQSWCYIEV